ncbi:hypothetical protein CYLTODRAFT_459731 [Cylindrobasidium torrendii FP15055 ss-10]|uniref:BZIP domain-containing protein n=1 Tax=Cylindrobasidium torrendii FP15055 ss-10 TaxID=1314674 RepID=A0A0D7AT98_9AGAR|nr:hypothetical protein CYLTODRAFT_459731 [Cylindrobasidium torrendii FP15055 ss-10]
MFPTLESNDRELFSCSEVYYIGGRIPKALIPSSLPYADTNMPSSANAASVTNHGPESPSVEDLLRQFLQLTGASSEDFDATGQQITYAVPFDDMRELETHFESWEVGFRELAMQWKHQLDAGTQILPAQPVFSGTSAPAQLDEADIELDAEMRAERNPSKRRVLQNRLAQRRSKRKRELMEKQLRERSKELKVRLSQEEKTQAELQMVLTSFSEWYALLRRVAGQQGLGPD